MIDHILIRVKNLIESKAFYNNTFSPLGYKISFGEENVFWSYDIGDKALFEIAQHNGQELTPCHVAFRVDNREQVKAFYQAALQAGGKCNGKPGLRPEYTENYYGAFILDPSGHNIEAMCYE